MAKDNACTILTRLLRSLQHLLEPVEVIILRPEFCHDLPGILRFLPEKTF